MKKAMEAASVVRKTQLGRSSGSFPHVLVVGYDQTCNKEIETKLQLCYFQVTTLREPSIAISLLRKIRGHFQLLMIDIDKCSHLASFINLKQFGLQMGLPVVMISRQENHCLMKKMLKSRVRCFLIKPINVELLRSTCEQYALKKNPLLRSAISQILPKKERIVWDRNLHHRFLEVMSKLGPKYCTPVNIANMMNVSGLTRKNVSSHLQSYLNSVKKPSKALPSRLSSIPTPEVGTFDNISLNHDQSTVKNLHCNTDLVTNRKNVGMYETPTGIMEPSFINNNTEIQKMSIDKNDKDSLNFDASKNFSILNEISYGITSSNHLSEFTLLNFDNDIDRPTSPYPPFPESYNQIPDSPSFTHALDQMISSFEPEVLENNQSQPNLFFANVEPFVSLKIGSSNFEYLYLDVINPTNFSNSNQVTKSIKNDAHWVVGANPNNDEDDDYDLFDWVSSFNITQGSSFSSHNFDEVDFEGLFV